ncbi:hypothetical protein EXIGLDRAFT_707846 [Exidia glandulosa HHB12029]|uniref:Spt20-like SEP domain-containing protein n=1 Tax=Exidia glandulosa HHB12029 TaxID=1314781 RepID=A0A166ATX2_EXIGL|nr:hypothetical protein EXIGLDRAFT_707846 [Exidia glandulosa HHB12029]
MTVASIDYNVSKWTNALLEKHKVDDPSFSVHFHEAHWTINNSATSQFLYTQAISSILEDIRALRIPTDFIELFDKSDVRFFEGCLIVALYDHRLRTSKGANANGAAEAGPEPQRVVLQPTAETLYADIKSLAEADLLQGKHWTDEQALEVESRILLLRASMPSVPRSGKRKRGDGLDEDGEEDEFLRRSKTKLMQFMNPRVGRTFNPRLTDGRLNFNAVREFLERAHPQPSGQLGASEQKAPLAINTGVPAQQSMLSAASGKGKGDPVKKEDRKPRIMTQDTVIRRKGLNKATDSPASASSSLPSAVEPEPKQQPRITLKINPPQSMQQSLAQVKKDEQIQQRVPTPVPVNQLAPGRVPTPVQPIRPQTPVVNQGLAAGVSQPAAPHPVMPQSSTTGLTFQQNQLPDGFLRQPPAPKNNNTPGSPAMAGKRPQTPLQAQASLMANQANAMKMAQGVSVPPPQAGQPSRPPATMPFNPALIAQNPMLAQHPAYQAALRQHMLALQAGRGGGGAVPIGTHNRFTGAMQMARPGAPGVAIPPNPQAGADPQQMQQWMQAAMMARGTAPPGAPVTMTAQQYQQLQWQMAAAGRGMPVAAMGRGQQMHPQQLALLQQHLAAGRGAQMPGAPGQPKPPGTR